MSSGTFIILNAYKKIGVHSVASPASPDSINDGKSVLNSMMERWLSLDIRIGIFPLRVAGDELNEPADTTDVIINNLAVAISPNFDNGKSIVSERLLALASDGLSEVERLYQRVPVPRLKFSSTLPRGSGHGSNGRRRLGVFFNN